MHVQLNVWSFCFPRACLPSVFFSDFIRHINNAVFPSQNQQVWCWIPDARWELGQVQKVSGDDVDILLSAGNVKILTCSFLTEKYHMEIR